MKLNRIYGRTALIASLTVIAACDSSDTIGPGSDFDPESLTVSYEWVFQRWEQNTPQGYGVVNLTWELPAGFSNEIFRVYARSATAGGYTLIATVTSCSNSVCRYGDTNIVAGRSYDYYIASVDQRSNNELGTSEAIRVDVPAAPSLTVPAPTAISLDRAAWVRWPSTGAQRYMVLSQMEAGPTFLIGETDGTSFYDSRAENGNRVRYSVRN